MALHAAHLCVLATQITTLYFHTIVSTHFLFPNLRPATNIPIFHG